MNSSLKVYQMNSLILDYYIVISCLLSKIKFTPKKSFLLSSNNYVFYKINGYNVLFDNILYYFLYINQQTKFYSQLNSICLKNINDQDPIRYRYKWSNLLHLFQLS